MQQASAKGNGWRQKSSRRGLDGGVCKTSARLGPRVGLTVSPRVWKMPASVTMPGGVESRWMRCTATESWPRLDVTTKSARTRAAIESHTHVT